MPPDDLSYTLLKYVDLQWPNETQHCGHVVRDALRIELIEKPQSLLRKRQRQRLVARDDRDRGSTGAVFGFQLGFDTCAQRGDRWGLEDRAQRYLELKALTNARDHLSSQ